MKKLLTIFFLAIWGPHFAQAQIQPPDFLCVKGDTLFWDLPMNSCGPFVAYEVYVSDNFDGPYSPLASVTDPAQDFYFHLNPSGQQWFYYLLSNFDCPGQMAIPSDTLDNRPPEVSPIRGLKVTGGDVQVDWYPSQSPEVSAYIVYRETDIGVVPIDTVFGGTSYLDTNAGADLQPESYFVNALDRCGNTSIFDEKHTTVFLGAAVSPCEQAITITWSLYANWPNGIGEQEIWAWEQGAMPEMVAAIGGAETSFDVTGLTDGLTYCIQVQPVEAVTDERSTSNVVCIMADIVQPADGLFLQNVNVLPTNEVEVAWGWNINAELSGAAVFSAPQNAGYQPVGNVVLQTPLQPDNVFIDGNAAPNAGQVFYQIQATDSCGDVQVSSYGATIFLSAVSLSGNMNRVNWTPLELQNATVQGYDVFKIVAGSTVFVAPVGPGETQFDDEFDPASLADAQACYFVVANASVVSPAGGQTAVESTSNVGCVSQNVRIFVPNAFAPDGVNQTFKPVIGFAENLARYELRVFDRSGGQLFFTTDPKEGWRGKKDGRKLPQGVYVYLISVTQSDGEVIEKRGTVLLLQ